MRQALSYLDRVLSSSLWTAEELSEQLDMRSPVELRDIMNGIMTGKIEIMSNRISAAQLLEIRGYMLTYLKGVAGYKLRPEEKDSFKGVGKFDAAKVLKTLGVLNSVLKYPYADQIMVDTFVAQAILSNKE